MKIEFIPIDLSIHSESLVELSLQYNKLMVDGIKSHFNLDQPENLQFIQKEFVENMVKKLISYKPPIGIFYLLKEKDLFIGMGAIHKLKEDISELSRIYILPEYRGKGYGKKLIKRLIKKGKDFGFKTIYLETPPFFKTSHNLYYSEGFHEREAYPEAQSCLMGSILPRIWRVDFEFQKYWMYMEKEL